MFTGLIESLGCVQSSRELDGGKEIIFSAPDAIFSQLSMGDSIAVNGVCSTVVGLEKGCFTIQYLKESLDKTTIGLWAVGDAVNLELCVTPETRLGGHIVTGHVDGVGQLLRCDETGPWHEIEVSFGANFAPFLIEKGSICIDGISLTVVTVTEASFTCHIIPHTYEHTVLKDRRVGDYVNLEYDVLAKYLDRFLALKHEINPTFSSIITQIGQDYDTTNI